MKDDKRRIPYNIWINVLGALLFLLIASVGVIICSLGYYADQKAVKDKTECNGYVQVCWSTYIYNYDNSIETESNFADFFCRTLAWLLGIVVICLGIWAWSDYASKHYWHKPQKNKSKKK